MTNSETQDGRRASTWLVALAATAAAGVAALSGLGRLESVAIVAAAAVLCAFGAMLVGRKPETDADRRTWPAARRLRHHSIVRPSPSRRLIRAAHPVAAAKRLLSAKSARTSEFAGRMRTLSCSTGFELPHRSRTRSMT